MKSNKANSEHYNWGEHCQGWHLLKSPSLGVIQEVMPPGSAEVRHKHQFAQQFFFILRGTASFELAHNPPIQVHAGEGIHIPKETVHLIKNNTAQDIEFLVISEPHAHGDRLIV